WGDAELATLDGVWANGPPAGRYDYGGCCSDCDRMAARGFNRVIRDAVKEGICNPEWFAARAAWVAVDLAGDGLPPERRAAAQQADRRAQRPLSRDVIGDPLADARPSPIRLSHHPVVRDLLTVIDRKDDIDPLILAVLADAIEESGSEERLLL